MRPRIVLAQFLKRLGRFISSLPLMVMRPDDLMEYGRQTYSRQEGIKSWGNDGHVTQGLTDMEKTVLEKTNLTRGKVLMLCLGGGREAIPLAKQGFSVTGVDFIPELIDIAQKNAAKNGVLLNTQLAEMTDLVPPPNTFDLIWLSDRMYSTIPTRRKRVEMLKRMQAALVPGGWFICEFFWSFPSQFSPRAERLRLLVARLCLGNLWYEPGDNLWGEFLHAFQSEDELASEFAEGGFVLSYLHTSSTLNRGNALLQKTT